MLRRIVILLAVVWSWGVAHADTWTGQVVCSQCWFEADRDEVAYGTPADLDCAARCAKQGIGTSLAIRVEDGFELLELRGRPPEGGSWLAWTGRFVEIHGDLVAASEGMRAIRPDAVEPLQENPWPLRDSPEEAPPGQAAELSWTDLRGRPFGLAQQPEQIVLINFWATWCRPCLKEMPDLVRLHDKFAPFGVRFLAASADDPQQVEAVLEYVRKKRINFPVVLGATTDQMESLGLPPTLPGTVILDEHGHPVERFAGVIDPDLVEGRLAALLGLPGADTSGRTIEAPKPAPIATETHRHGHGEHASLVPS